jgi:hypothetical protein
MQLKDWKTKGFMLLLWTAVLPSRGVFAQQDTFVGTWNYDEPSPTTRVNMATIHIPGAASGKGLEFPIPQIGNIVFASGDGAGRFLGRTDQGCTWTFKTEGDWAELDPPSQTCFNQVIGSSYTITHWSIPMVDTAHATERVLATSHLPMGESDFTLDVGRRTKADQSDSSRLFEGTWTYDVSEPPSRVNVVQVSCDRSQERSESQPRGEVAIEKTGQNTLLLTTPDGCSWNLEDHGNTAVVGKPQVCESPAGKVTLEHWTAASDGHHMVTVMKVIRETKSSRCALLLSSGSLSRK